MHGALIKCMGPMRHNENIAYDRFWPVSDIEMKRFFIGIGVGIIFTTFAFATMMLGTYVNQNYDNNLLGIIIAIPGIIFMLPALPFAFLIDVLPMDKIFPKGGASGVFGSLYIFAFVLWCLIFGLLARYKKWPFQQLN